MKDLTLVISYLNTKGVCSSTEREDQKGRARTYTHTSMRGHTHTHPAIQGRRNSNTPLETGRELALLRIISALNQSQVLLQHHIEDEPGEPGPSVILRVGNAVVPPTW